MCQVNKKNGRGERGDNWTNLLDLEIVWVWAVFGIVCVRDPDPPQSE
jgi:hypothetical protein